MARPAIFPDGNYGKAGKLISYPFRMESRPTERTDDYVGFAAWLRSTMRRKGYEVDGTRAGGQQRLATDTGLSPGAISKYMTGKSLPRVEEMVKLAGPLGTTVRELLLRSGRVIEDDLVPDTGNPLVDPMLDKIYAMDYLPMATRKARAEDFLRRVEDARRLTEHELEQDLRLHQEEHDRTLPNGT